MNPTRSANRTVTTRRSSATSVIAWPQWEQNRAPSATAARQAGHSMGRGYETADRAGVGETAEGAVTRVTSMSSGPEPAGLRRWLSCAAALSARSTRRRPEVPPVTVTEPASPAAPTGAIAARAVDAVKTYGSGDTVVRALDGVTLDIHAGRFTAVMGPSGSGKSTLMHCMAGLDDLTSGQVLIGEIDLTELKEKELTVLRRDHVGFVFQAFNLVPTLTAEENIILPLSLGGRSPDKEWIDQVIEHRRPGRTGSITARRSCRVASSSGWPWPEPWSAGPRSLFADEPTGNLDSNTRRRDPGLHAPRGRRAAARRSSWSPTTPSPPSYADRVVFLVDGKIVDDMTDPTTDRVLDQHQAPGGLSRCSRSPSRASWPARSALLTTALAVAARRGLRRRHPRPHRHHHARPSTTCSPT